MTGDTKGEKDWNNHKKKTKDRNEMIKILFGVFYEKQIAGIRNKDNWVSRLLSLFNYLANILMKDKSTEMLR